MIAKIIKQLLLISFLSYSFTALAAKDEDQDKENLSKEEIANIIKNATNLKKNQLDKVLKMLDEKFGKDHEGNLRISGLLLSRGVNYSIIKDRKKWYFNASFIPDDTNTVVHVPKLYIVEFFNGGFKIELGYKWVFLFIPSTLDIEALDGAIFGRGLAMQAGASGLTGLDIGWMPGETHPGHMIYLAPIVGMFLGVSFPKMKFQINPKIKN